MIKAIAMEFRKIRRRRVWAIVAALVFVQILWSLWGVQRMDAHDLSQGWMYFLYQFPLLNSIMMPIIAAVVASRLCDIEHKGQMFKIINTVMPAQRLFAAKFFCGALYMLAAVILQLVVIVAVGYATGFDGNPPSDKLLYYLLFTTVVNLTILLLQQVCRFCLRTRWFLLQLALSGALPDSLLCIFRKALKGFYFGDITAC